jgi:hypothetical protein
MAMSLGRARVPPLRPDERDERQAALIEQAGAELSVFTTLVRNPEVFGDFLPFGRRLLRDSSLDPRVRVSRVRTKSCPMAFDLPCGRTAEFHAGGQVISGLG